MSHSPPSIELFRTAGRYNLKLFTASLLKLLNKAGKLYTYLMVTAAGCI